MTPVADLVRNAKVLVFDFDGTLVDSNPIKLRAFETCFAEFPHRREEILAYCLGHHAVPRGDKFRHVYERIIGLPYTDATAIVLHKRFFALTTDQIVAAPEIAGASAFLESVHGDHRTALLSSTPHQILVHLLVERGWSRLFSCVRGAPVDKREWLVSLRGEWGLGEGDAVVFGDTDEDVAAAWAAGCVPVMVGEAPVGAHVPRIRDFRVLVNGGRRPAKPFAGEPQSCDYSA
jgi:phosphoglycolate phosphatase-like HAD superfamily hydrolase